MRLTTLVALALLAPTSTSAQETLLRVNGKYSPVQLGRNVDILGDVDGDGFDDFLAVGWHRSRLYVYSGVSGAELLAIEGPTGAATVFSVDRRNGVGDVNGDGVPDFCAGEPSVQGGSIVVFSGTGAPLLSASGNKVGDYFGAAVNGAGDINNDGFCDIVVGALGVDAAGGTNVGSVSVLSGFDGTMILQAFGRNNNDILGHTVCGAGDVDGDGVDDVVAGGNGLAAAAFGRVQVVSGATGTALHTFTSPSPNDRFGNSVAATDLNLDGHPDIVIGAAGSLAGNEKGRVVVFSGLDWTTLSTFYGDQVGDFFGTCVRGGDLDGDGYGDVVVGAPNHAGVGAFSGYLRSFSGWDGRVLYTMYGESAFDTLGTACGTGGDVNGDGFQDVIVGIPGASVTASYAGAVKVFSMVPAGVAPFGGGTAPCVSPQTLTADRVPVLGEGELRLLVYPTPKSSVGVMLFSGAGDRPGSNSLGVGALIHVAPPTTIPPILFPSLSDANGSVHFATPVPNNPSLVGVSFVIQHLSVWPSDVCGALGVLKVSSSNGVVITVQP